MTFGGQPVASGVITFIRSDGPQIREGGVIKDGRFSAVLPPGSYRVELSAPKVTGKRKQKGFDGKDEEVEVTEELFPERYNLKTTLTAQVDSGTTKLQFDVPGTN